MDEVDRIFFVYLAIGSVLTVAINITFGDEEKGIMLNVMNQKTVLGVLYKPSMFIAISLVVPILLSTLIIKLIIHTLNKKEK